MSQSGTSKDGYKKKSSLQWPSAGVELGF